jgi:bacterioferritin (cytochrome b1)
MKKILNLKFKKKYQKVFNKLFEDEEEHIYTLGEVLGIFTINIILMALVILLSTIK